MERTREQLQVSVGGLRTTFQGAVSMTRISRSKKQRTRRAKFVWVSKPGTKKPRRHRKAPAPNLVANAPLLRAKLVGEKAWRGTCEAIRLCLDRYGPGARRGQGPEGGGKHDTRVPAIGRARHMSHLSNAKTHPPTPFPKVYTRAQAVDTRSS